MIAIIYQFHVKENKTEQFLQSWKELTELIYQYENSLGSRLHHHNDNIYIAYAQWPDEHTWNHSGNQLPEQAKVVREKMREACHSIEKLYELEATIDLLKLKGKRTD